MNKINKILKTIFSVLLFTCSANLYAWGNWIDEPYDKVAHGFFGFGVTTGGYYLLKKHTKYSDNSARWMAFGTAAGLSLLKEISDQNFDNEDLAAGVLGAAAGFAITFTF